jgi:two-component system sensor histidine kinase/response regulator
MTTHTVLVVDDEPASVRAVARALADDCRVVTATTGTQGLAALTAERIALMIVDQRMPEMTGTELLARSAGQHPDIIRVLLTGYTDVETLVDAINAGQVYYYLTKPWEPRELRLIVRRGLERYEVEGDRRRLLGELEQAYARVRREADQKGRLLALAAHELGTPLHLLSNALTLMAEAGLPPRTHPWLDTAHRSAEWLGRVLAQINNGARWHGGSLKLHRSAVDLTAVLHALQTTFRPVVTARRLTLHVDIPNALPTLHVDRTWFARALANLLSNAVRFTPDGGSITLAAAARATTLEIRVTDTGIGIEPSLLDEVFEPFSAACGDVALHTSGRFEFGSRGLGLGLAVTKAIVDEHGGTIAVQSAVGAGSQFTISFPRLGV